MAGQSGYDTNLASEFFVLSSLHRLGLNASLTLGNKKSVDLFVARDSGEVVTIDVKGVAKKDDWPVDNLRKPTHERHFIVFVSFEGKIREPASSPSVWIIPYASVAPFIKQYDTRAVVSRKRMNDAGNVFKNRWDLLTK
jgi:hypothetical protein